MNTKPKADFFSRKDLAHTQEVGRMEEDRDRWRELASNLIGHMRDASKALEVLEGEKFPTPEGNEAMGDMRRHLDHVNDYIEVDEETGTFRAVWMRDA